MWRLGQRASERQPSTGGRPVYAVGDIHGRYDLLYKLMLKIEEDLRETRAVRVADLRVPRRLHRPGSGF